LSESVSLGTLSRHQGRVKLHPLLDLRDPIPTMIAFSDGKQPM